MATDGPRGIIRQALLWGTLVWWVWCQGQVAQDVPPQSDHATLRAVPTPGVARIDGVLDDWDRSAEMLVYGIRQKRDFYSARVYSMWDPQALYIGIQWRDPTPMINNLDADAAPGDGWMADCFQRRFVTDWSQIHLTAWYSSVKDKSVIDVRYDQPLNTQGMYQHRGTGTRLEAPGGFIMAFRRDRDQRGYVQERRLPWALLYKQPSIKPGITLRFSGEYFWDGPSGTKWPAVMWSDPFNQQPRQRVVFYQAPRHWGELQLLAHGNLPQVVQEEDDNRLQGPVVARVEVPAQAEFFPARWGSLLLQR